MMYQNGNNSLIGWIKLLLGITFIETYLPYLTGIANWMVIGVFIIGGLIVLPITLPIVLAWAIIIHIYKRDVANDEEELRSQENALNDNDFDIHHRDITKK